MKDEYQKMGAGRERLYCLTYLAKKRGLLGFTAEVLVENEPMLNLFKNMGSDTEKRRDEGVYEMRMMFSNLEHG